ncbi:SusC/RagA family TonB-linked outer membrane protein [Rhabdobacter roseus]|uniref:TonB-linked SusC/RagA family outer membrane protein n=1 Tax=Rhabdobacter roseus TaxID=1655419 RepID=A0A840U0G7_9BACT|nr:SusC/RagA family TonB-linked outer membrane protein [Rhabdobacter roseus]MBB5287392.1 TonB-linked SusC/RagA family outer membrane protein [Rhabdobacter roseus]
MKTLYKDLVVLVCGMLLLCPGLARAQQSRTLQGIVADENGKPIKGAWVYANEGIAVGNTDMAGKFALAVTGASSLLVEAEGYESAVFEPEDYLERETLTLRKSDFLLGQKDDVRIAFGKVKKANLVNAVSVLDPVQLRRFDNTQTVASALTGMLPGLLGSSNVRGIGTPLFVVDGLPRDISTLNLAEVEQITVLKDINSAIMYGNQAVNGVVLVTTKRGQAYKRQINASAFYGISRPTTLPEYLPSADYMELYNEARTNDGLGIQYSPDLIQKYRTGNPYRYPSIDYYSGEYLKSFRPFSRATMDFSGGNRVATYYSNIGWTQTGSLYNFGEGKSAKSNVFNVRGNIDLKVNSWIKSALDAVVVLNNDRSPQGNFWANAATLRPNLFAPLVPISSIDPENAILKRRKNDIDGMYLLGGTTTYQTNPIAAAYAGGELERLQRTFSFNNRIDFDLSRSVQGLAFHTNLSFDYLTLYDQFISNQYAVYEPVWDEQDRIISLRQFGEDVRSGTQNVGNASYRRRIGFYGLLDYDRTFQEAHQVSGSLLAFLTNDKVQEDLQGNKNANLGLRLNYGYKSKYLVDFSSAYVHSVKLPEGNRTAFSPSLGLAWVMSSEDFLSSTPFLDYLKVRLSAGIMHSDAGIDGFYYYNNRFGGSGSYSWYEGTRSRAGTVSVNGGNNLLAFEKRKEVNLGFESMLFNKRLSLDANVFSSLYSDIITRPQTIYPSYFTSYIPYQNFDENAYHGAEMGVSYQQQLGDFSLVLGVNALYANSKVRKKDELYADSYRFRTGHPVDARFGLVADGFFSDQAEIDRYAIQAFGAVKPGDLKYLDQNGDGIIDANDERRIGRSQAPFSYGLNLKLSYKNLTLFARGNGRAGADGMLSNDYFWVDGDDKYSTYVLGRWTEATKATATFPRLSSIANTNNYRSSSFWLYRDNFFTLDRLQLTYDIPIRLSNRLNLKSLSCFADASNLVMLSAYRSIRELNIGTEPQYRSFSLGFNAWF